LVMRMRRLVLTAGQARLRRKIARGARIPL
jgi:hypothetical protein